MQQKQLDLKAAALIGRRLLYMLLLVLNVYGIYTFIELAMQPEGGQRWVDQPNARSLTRLGARAHRAVRSPRRGARFALSDGGSSAVRSPGQKVFQSLPRWMKPLMRGRPRRCAARGERSGSRRGGRTGRGWGRPSRQWSHTCWPSSSGSERCEVAWDVEQTWYGGGGDRLSAECSASNACKKGL